MKEPQNEIRIKLHITSIDSSNVKNLWMCLNYDQKPTIGHIIDHIKRNYCSSLNEYSNSSMYSFKNNDNTHELFEVKLYLDDYWLPPCENSRLIRESDCIKVELNSLNHDESINKKVPETQRQKIETNIASIAAAAAASHEFYNNNNNYNYAANPSEYYYDYYNQLNQMQSQSCATKEETSRQQNGSNKKQQKELASVSKETTINNSKSFKKFAVGGLINMLKEEANTITTNFNSNENNNNNKSNNKKKAKGRKNNNESDSLSEEQSSEISSQKNSKKNTNQQKQNKSQENPKIQQQQQQVVNGSIDIGKIAANLKSTGTAKWKNSTKSTTAQNTHIIFSSSSDSSSSSSTESDNEKNTNERNQVKQIDNKKQENLKKTKNNNNANKNKQKNKYYEPTKEEQLNALSNNRTFHIENTKDLTNFKKVFNQAKLNAPSAEKFMHKNADIDNQNLDTSTSSTNSSSSSTSNSSSGEVSGSKKNKKRSPSPQVDFSKFEQLTGAPRVNDKLAFQVLEISSNFTPEISKYKTGTVVEFDVLSNEITLKLNSKYNAILKKPSKFSVVFDDDNEIIKEKSMDDSSNHSSLNEEDDLLKIDWRNLMNVKLLSKETLPTDSQQQLTQINQESISVN